MRIEPLILRPPVPADVSYTSNSRGQSGHLSSCCLLPSVHSPPQIPPSCAFSALCDLVVISRGLNGEARGVGVQSLYSSSTMQSVLAWYLHTQRNG